MLALGIVLNMVGLGFFCWVLFTLAVYALPLFVLCGRPHKTNYVASLDMWRTGRSMPFPSKTREKCATYCFAYRDRRKVIKSGRRDQPPDERRVLPLASVANARFFVARSVSA